MGRGEKEVRGGEFDLTTYPYMMMVRPCRLIINHSVPSRKPEGYHSPSRGGSLHTGWGLFIRANSMKTPELSHAFKGVWIRASLWRNDKLSWFQKCLLAEIDNLQDGCFASNPYLAKIMGVPERTVTNNLTALRKLGLIIDWGTHNGRRQISVADSVSSDPKTSLPGIGYATYPESGSIDTSGDSSKSEEPKESTSVEVAPIWKPDQRSKEEKLKAIKSPKDCPSESDFNAFVEREELSFVANVDVYRRLCLDKWRQWDGRNWRRIKYWQAYVHALNSKMEEAAKRN